MPRTVAPKVTVTERKCVRCSYRGPETSFPRSGNLKYKKNCATCLAKAAKRKAEKKGQQDESDSDKENTQPGQGARSRSGPDDTPHVSWNDFLSLLREHSDSPFQLTAFVALPPRDILGDTSSAGPAVPSGKEQAKMLAAAVREATGYRFK